MKIFYSSQFLRKYKQLPEEIREKLKKRGKIFHKNPFDSRLKTHKLQGELHEFWSFSVDFKYRVIFKFDGKSVAKFYNIGGHSIYF